MLVSSYHYLEGPLIAVAALGVIVLLCRWVFSTDHRTSRPSEPPGPPGPRDYGLLTPVCTAATPQDAALLQARLRDAGIRCTVATGTEELALLVFAADVPRAQALVRS